MRGETREKVKRDTQLVYKFECQNCGIEMWLGPASSGVPNFVWSCSVCGEDFIYCGTKEIKEAG